MTKPLLADAVTEPLNLTPSVIVSRSPVDGRRLGEVPVATALQIESALEVARVGQVAWDGIGLKRRMVFARALRDAFYRQHERLIQVLVDEQGKVAQEAEFEYLASIELLDYYVREAERILDVPQVGVRLLPNRKFHVVHRPYGVVLVIAPWNYPLYLSITPIIMALIAGNSVVYKPSEYATQLGDVIESVIKEAGLPDEVFHILHGHGDVGAALIDARPDRIVFTGSVPTGQKIAMAAAKHLIPVTLELGGNDAAIVLDDADIEFAAEGIVWAGMFNAGQTCASAERVLVQESVADRLVAAIKRVIEANIVDGSAQPGPWLAAISNQEQLDVIRSQVDEAVDGGARVVIGGHAVPGKRLAYMPTVLTDVTPDMRICCDETFGPVLVIMPFKDDAEAVRRNNETHFGLTASIWTENRERGLRLARRLEVGSVSLNQHLVIGGVPEMPWGGVKASGYGRTRGAVGLLEMTYMQVVDYERFRLPVQPFWYPYTRLKSDLVGRAIHLLYGPGWRDRLKGIL